MTGLYDDLFGVLGTSNGEMHLPVTAIQGLDNIFKIFETHLEGNKNLINRHKVSDRVDDFLYY